MKNSADSPLSAVVLGWAGVLPFAGLAVAIMITPSASTYQSALVSYAAVILSFMGGVHWGLAMNRQDPARHLTLSIVPALVAWVATLIEFHVALIALAVAFSALLMVDLFWSSSNGAPGWYGRLRLQLTSAVLLCLAVAWIST